MIATVEPRGMQLFDELTSFLDRADDPLGFEAGDANLYRYVGNAPTMLTDPFGLDPVPGGNGYGGPPPSQRDPGPGIGALPPSGRPFPSFNDPEGLKQCPKPDLDWYKDRANKINEQYRETIKNTDDPGIKQRFRDKIENQNQRIRDINEELNRRMPGPKGGPCPEPPIPWWRIPLPIWLWPPPDWLHPDPRNPTIA